MWDFVHVHFILFGHRLAVISDGKVCHLLKEGVRDDSSYRPWWTLASPMCSKKCALCVRYLQPSSLFATTTPSH